MASSTVFDLISASLGKSLEQIIIPKFAEIAVSKYNNMLIEYEAPDLFPDENSQKVLFEIAFKEALANPGKKSSTKSKTTKNETSEKKEKASPKPKVKKTPAPKPQWLSLSEMKEHLDGTQHFCGFVADRGPNKGKFCATVLTEEHKNCGTMSADGWVPHTPEKEFEEVGNQGARMRCKKCWAKGKNGCYRKEGAAEKLYADEFAKAAELPEIPEVPNSDINEPVEELTDAMSSVTIEDKYSHNTDDEMEECPSDNEMEECPSDDEEENTENLLDGLLDN